MTTQLRRAAVSVVTNIAEGARRQSSPDYGRFLNMAQGSLSETECLLMICRDLGLTGSTRIQALLAEIDEIGRMLSALRKAVLRVS